MSKRVGHSPAITSEQSWGDWYNANHLLLNPLVTGTVVGLAGVVNALLLPMWPHTVLWVGVGLLVALFTTVNLKDRGQRAFYRAFFIASAAWFMMLQTSLAWDHWRGFVVGWLCATLVGAGGYWTDQRVRSKIRLSDEEAAWPDLAAQIGIPKAWITPKHKTDSGYSRRLSWPRGAYNISRIKGLSESLENALGIPHGQMRLMPVKDKDENIDSGCIDIVVNTEAASRKAPVPFTVPTMRHITDPMNVGPYEDGETCEVYWYTEGYGGIHTLAAGITRSGKSCLYHLMLAETAACVDVVRLGIDAKGGMALRPWAPMFEWLVVDRNSKAQAEQAAMLEWLNAEMMERETYAGEKGWDVWRVSRKHPLIILYIDEAKEVLGMKLENFTALSLVEKIGTMGTGVGVLLCMATQYPTLDALASSQIQANVGRRFCFRVERVQHQYVILPKGVDIDATFPDKPKGDKGAGHCFLNDGGEMKPMSLRVRHVDHSKIRGIVEEYADLKCPMRPLNTQVCVAEFEARKRWKVADLPRPGAEDDDTWDDESTEIVPEGTAVPGTVGLFDEGVTVTQSSPGSVTVPVTTSVTEIVTELNDGIESTGVDIDFATLLAPRTAEDVEILAQAQAHFATEMAEWTPEKARAEFWRVFTLAGADGIRVGKLALLCHRSTSWTGEELRLAREAGQLVPAASKGYYRIAPGVEIPTQTAHAE